MNKAHVNDLRSRVASLEVCAHPEKAPANNSRLGNAPLKNDRSNPNLEAVGRIANGVAHDFNNLLTGVLLYCDLMTDEINHSGRRVPDKNKLRHAAEEIRYTCQRGTALIQQFMVVARPAAFEPASVSWNDAFSGMSNLLRRLLGDHIELIADLAIDLKTVDLSLTRAQQVILNLVLNSRDAMPKGGKIVLQTRNRAGGGQYSHSFVELSVTDTGCGMDQRTLAHAFEPFFTTKPPEPGNGLGLATVHGIITQGGGEILIESQPGCGTCIHARLPVGWGGEAAAEKQSVPRGPISHSRPLHSANPKLKVASMGSVAVSAASCVPAPTSSNSTGSSVTKSSTSTRRRLS